MEQCQAYTKQTHIRIQKAQSTVDFGIECAHFFPRQKMTNLATH